MGVGFLSLPLQLHRAVRRRQRDEAPPKAAEAGGAPAAARPRAARPGSARPGPAQAARGTDPPAAGGPDAAPGLGEESARPA